jgi:putative transcriptional regulator
LRAQAAGVAWRLLVPTAMARNADDLLQGLLKRMADGAPEPHRHRKRRKLIDEEPEGLYPPPRRPTYSGSPSPLEDPLRHIKRPLQSRTGPDRGGAYVEFSQVHIVEIRYKFHATQRQFARMLGISLQTLRNWEQGKRRAHGPSRALLRVAAAHPEAVARTLWRYRRVWWLDND